MGAKLAEFRKIHAPKKPLINYHAIMCRLKSFFSFSSTKCSETKAKEEEERINWQIILIKFLVW
jgi:hypothetical protein